MSLSRPCLSCQFWHTQGRAHAHEPAVGAEENNPLERLADIEGITRYKETVNNIMRLLLETEGKKGVETEYGLVRLEYCTLEVKERWLCAKLGIVPHDYSELGYDAKEKLLVAKVTCNTRKTSIVCLGKRE